MQYSFHDAGDAERREIVLIEYWRNESSVTNRLLSFRNIHSKKIIDVETGYIDTTADVAVLLPVCTLREQLRRICLILLYTMPWCINGESLEQTNLHTILHICQGPAALCTMFVFIATVSRVLLHFLFCLYQMLYVFSCTLTFTLATKWWIFRAVCIFPCAFLSRPVLIPIGRRRLPTLRVKQRKIKRFLSTGNYKEPFDKYIGESNSVSFTLFARVMFLWFQLRYVILSSFIITWRRLSCPLACTIFTEPEMD